jgi:hypothetical protein
MSTTDLAIKVSGVNIVPPYSARGITQALEPIEASIYMRRTVNGDLDDLSASQFRKYRTIITCNDQQPLALNAIYPGQQVTVDCVYELSYPTATGSAARTAVAGSSRTEGDFTFYRPQLTMRVETFQTFRDEYGASVGWELEMVEV